MMNSSSSHTIGLLVAIILLTQCSSDRKADEVLYSFADHLEQAKISHEQHYLDIGTPDTQTTLTTGWGHPQDKSGMDYVWAINTQAEIDFVANGNWTGSNHGTDMEFYITPSGTTTKQLAANLSDNGINLPTGTTYNVGGVDIIPELISQAEAEAGTSETERIFSALRVAQAIDAQTPAFTAFTAYTPSYTNLTIGNAVVTARYTKIGTLVVGTVEIIFGTTTSVSGSVYVSLPSTPNGIIRSPIAICTYLEAGVAQYTGLGVVQSGSVRLKAFNVASTYAKQVDINASIPFTWGTGDQILFEFYYEE